MPFFVNYIRTKSLGQSPYINEKRPKIDIATTRLNRPWADSVNYFFVLFLIGHAVFVNLFSQFAYFLDEIFFQKSWSCRKITFSRSANTPHNKETSKSLVYLIWVDLTKLISGTGGCCNLSISATGTNCYQFCLSTHPRLK